MATAVPRSKKRRIAASTIDQASAGMNAAPYNGHGHRPANEAPLSYVSASSAASSASHPTAGPSSAYAHRHPPTSVRELINGKETEVFVLDDDSPPPARPLGLDNHYDSTANAFPYYSRNGGHLPDGGSSGQHRAPDVTSTAARGKRKAAGSAGPETGAPSAKRAMPDNREKMVYAPPAGRTATSKRRKADGAVAQVADAHAAPPASPLQAASYLAAYPPHSHHTALQVPATAALPSSYRGGYPSLGGSGQAQPTKHLDAAARQYGYYADVDRGRDSYASTASFGLPPPPPNEPVDDKEGHFIVRKGDNVTPRYKILSLLGQGTFGKVVECWDRERRRYVAIKIIRAIQKYRDASQIEIRVLETLRKNDPANENKCIHLLDTFSFRNHVCIVSELLGKSVFDFLKENQFRPFPPRQIWAFAKQLMQSVAFLHRLNLVHTDLKPENILLVNSQFDSVAATKRSKTKMKRVLQETDIRLIDFGSATFNDEYHSQVVSTRHYRAPEIILQMGWSFPCDVWSIGCILVEFYTGDALFQTHDNLEHLAMMEAVLGPLPDDYRRKAETYRPDLFRGGRLNYPNAETHINSKRYVKAMKKLQDIVAGPTAYHKHNSRFLHLLQRLLTYDANQRIKVADALRHPYFELGADDFPP